MSDTPPSTPSSASTDPADAAPDAPAPDAPSKGGRSWRLWLSVGILAVVAIVAVVVVLASRGSQEYSSEDQLKFMSACTTLGGEPVKGTCTCIYEQITTHIPYDRYVELDAQLKAARQGDNPQALQLPPDVEVIRADCVNRAGGSSAQAGAFGDQPGQTTVPGAPKYSTPETLENGPTSALPSTTAAESFSRPSTTTAPAGGGAAPSTTAAPTSSRRQSAGF